MLFSLPLASLSADNLRLVLPLILTFSIHLPPPRLDSYMLRRC